MCVSPFLGQEYTSVLKDLFFRRRESKGETREIVSNSVSSSSTYRVEWPWRPNVSPTPKKVRPFAADPQTPPDSLSAHFAIHSLFTRFQACW